MDFIIGTYTKKTSKGIYKFSLPECTINLMANSNNPTYISKTDNLLLTSTGTSTLGGINLYSLDKDNNITLLDTALDFNCPPCFVSLYKDFAFACNYHQGNLIIYKLKENKLMKLKTITIPNGKLHFCKVFKDTLFLVDLNSNKILAYSLVDFTLISELLLSENSGPRHLCFYKDFIYVITEKTNEILVLSFKNSLKLLKTYKLYGIFSNKLEGSAIKCCNGFIFSSERFHNTISVFKILENGFLKHLQNFSHSSINSPRDFIVTKDFSKLISCNYSTNSLSVFSLNNGIIDKFLFEVPVPEPICIDEI